MMAIKHKNSLVLKENRLHGKNCTIEQSKLRRCKHSFPWSTLCVFVVYWFILCPLIWAIYYKFAYWPSYWSFLFWIVAFLIWLVIMCGLIIFWRRFQVEQSLKINATSKYGSDKERKPLSIHQTSFEDAEFFEMKKRNDSHDSEAKQSDREILKKDLPPLVIHKQISGEDIEDTAGTVCVEENERTRLSIVNDCAQKSPLRDYLKLVTVSPSEDEMRSSKTPMSPRELFFIDLIREAERVESAKSLKIGTYFFPSEATKNDNAETVKSISDGKDTEDKKDIKDMGNENAKDEEDNKLTSKRESSYFIADVESPIHEKTEVFLQINPNMNEETEL